MTKKHITFSFIGLVDIFFASTAIIIIMILVMVGQTKIPTFIPQEDERLYCENKRYFFAHENHLKPFYFSAKQLKDQVLKMKISRPIMRVNVYYDPLVDRRCRIQLSQVVAQMNENVDHNNLPFIFLSWIIHE